MMMIKSLALGLGMFLVGTIAYLALRLRPYEHNTATGISVLMVYTIFNSWFWLAFIATLGVAYFIVRRVGAAA